jgi:hypothetical protein
MVKLLIVFKWYGTKRSWPELKQYAGTKTLSQDSRSLNRGLNRGYPEDEAEVLKPLGRVVQRGNLRKVKSGFPF